MCLHIHSLMTKKKPLYGNIRIIYSEMKQMYKSNSVGSIFALSATNNYFIVQQNMKEEEKYQQSVASSSSVGED